MLEMKYVGEASPHSVSFSRVSGHIVQLLGEFPVNTVGFTLSRIGKTDNWDYTGYTTVFREVDGGVQFSDDGSVYVEPVKPIPVVKFIASDGGILEGITEQEAGTWEEVVVPTPVPDEGYVFGEWSPAIPDSSEAVNSGTYTAVFKDCRVYFGVSGEGGYLEGEACQHVGDYSELVIPTPVPYEDYKFTGWSPEIPVEGEVDLGNLHFDAVFQSNLPERIASLEGDMKALNRAMGGE